MSTTTEKRPLTPEEISRLAMERRKRRAGGEDRPKRGAIPRRPEALAARPPASFAQQRLWLLDRLQPGSAAYVMPFAYRLRGELTPADRRALARALTELARRHESLRTTFGEEDGQPVQRIAPSGEARLDLVVEDLSALAAAERRTLLDERLAAESARPFDLARGPLARARLFVLGFDDHVLLLDVHHAVFDGWSLGVLWKELSALYRAFREGRPSPLAEPAIQYADFAVWQRERMAGAELERHLSYWRERLADPPAALELPTDRPRPGRPSDRGAVASLDLPPDLVAALRSFARKRGGSLFMALLTGMEVLLARLSGQDDLLIGVPDAGRGRTELEEVVGFFVNALTVRARVPEGAGFGELFDATRREVLGATAHQDVPLEKLLEELQPERSVSRAPLFQAMFNMVDLGGEEPALPGLEIEKVDCGFDPSKFDFTIYAETRGDRVHLDLLYSVDLFDRPRIDAMLDGFEHLLRQCVEAPEAPVAELSLVTPAAARVLPDPRAPLGTAWHGPIHHALTRHAEAAPERPAAVDRWGGVTYGELEARSNRLAHRLRSSGVGAGDVVAILGHRDASLAVAVFGALKSGAAFCVLDPDHPPARLVAYLGQLRPRALVELAAAGSLPPEADAALADAGTLCRLRLPARAGAAEARFLEGEPATPPRVPLGPDDAATVVFTSGSTGVPKGVLGRHGSLTHFLPWWRERFGLGAADRFSVLSALSHDPLQRDLFVPVWLGAPMLFPDPDRIGEPGWLAAWAAREEVTVSSVTPAMLQLLTQAGDRPAEARELRLPALRTAFVIGDVLTRAHVARLRAIAPGARCYNLYGSTETQRALACHEADLSRSGKEVLPLGRGIPDVQVLVVRPDGGLCGIGEPGEIWMRSPHVALGYLGDPELTAARFAPNTFTGADGASPEPWDRIYRTGDIGRYQPDGGVEFAGRADGQVKIRGFRIETGEVESVLAGFPGVAECAVTVRDDLPGGRGLAGYLALDRGADFTVSDLRAHLLERLPDYMAPAVFVFLDALPRTATGKLDRRSLPAPAHSDLVSQGERTTPRDEVEELLAELWCDLLGIPEVGVEQDFFALGGHSLLATRMISRIRTLFDREVPLAALFEKPTVAALARHIRESGEDAVSLPPVRPLSPAEREERIPLAWAQRRVWFLERLELSANTAHHVTQALELQGELSVPALERVVAALVRRHEPLRTRIVEGTDGMPYQEIEPAQAEGARVELPVYDLSGVPAAARTEELYRWIEHEASQPFALSAELPSRWRLARMGARMGEERWVLLMVFHHIATDGWSYGVLFRDLAGLYRAELTGEPAGLPELSVGYADWSAWQRSWLDGPELDAQLDYWTRTLAGAPQVLEIPTDLPRPAQQSFRGRRAEAVIDRQASEALRGFCREVGVTPYMALLAAFGVLLARMSGQEDLLVGTPIANRRSAEVEDLVGLFSNLLALRVDLSSKEGREPGLAEMARRVREASLGAFAHQDLPWERLVDALGVDRDLTRPPVVQYLFAVQNAPHTDLDMPGLEAEVMHLPGIKSQTDFYAQVVDLDGELKIVAEYCADLFEEATVRKMLERFVRLVAEGVARPERSVWRLPWLDAAERRALLSAGDGGDPVRAAADTLHGLVAARAEEHPERPAVSWGDVTLSYGDLMAGARRLAHHLRALGGRPEAPIGVLVERSPAMLTSLLGVLEAGSCYLPLDPSYPPDRLAAMARDAGVEVIVTEQALAGLLDVPELAGARRVVIDGADRDAIAGRPATPVGSGVAGGNRAYVLYTSGSTGRPKGVEVLHESAVAFLAAMARAPGVGPRDTVLATTTISFDISLLELFLPLSVGARVRLVGRETAADGEALAAALADVTVAQATPTSWWMLVESGWRGQPGLKVLSGGEALDRELAERLLPEAGHGEDDAPAGVAELWNVYGPTETTVWSSAGRVRPVSGDHGTVPIGRAIPGTRLYVVDSHGALCPMGVPGELWIAGAGVARGYRRRPALTAGVFVPDPFAAEPGGRAYRTGDLVRWRSDGELECLGRLDQQVKVRGHRIEPGEIESALAAREDVSHVVVTTFPRGASADAKRLAAYLVVEPSHEEPTVDQLRAHLEETLPPYMVPAAFVVLPELPRTPNGKVDRKALPEPDASRMSTDALYVAPSTEAEKALAEIWSEVLGLEKVGTRDRFFHLGGDSILALKVVARAARAGWTIQVRDIFRFMTLGDLAGVARRGGLASPPALEPIDAPLPDTLDFREAGLSEDELDELLSEIG